MKYIAPLKGTKIPITVNDHLYWKNEHPDRKRAKVEMWTRDKVTRKITYPPIQFDFAMRSKADEEFLLNQRLMRKLKDEKEVTERNFFKIKYEAD